MSHNNNKNEQLPQTFIRQCSCGYYHLHYRYIMLTIPMHTLFGIMDECYTWEKMRSHESGMHCRNPFRLVVGVASLAILPEDFEEFNEAVQQAAYKALNIMQLIQQTGSQQ